MLRAVNHCGKACGVRLPISFFSLLPWVDYTRLAAAMRTLCAFAENASFCGEWAPPMDCGALRAARVPCVGRGGAGVGVRNMDL